MIKMKIQTIEFSNVDEIIEMFESRFENANVEMIESMRNEMIMFYSSHAIHDVNTKRQSFVFEFDAMHETIERFLRQSIAINFSHAYSKQIDANDEFVHALIANDANAHEFEIVDMHTRETIVKFTIARTSISIVA